MMYPAMPTVAPPIMKGPRTLSLSEKCAVMTTKKKATMFGGTVSPCALTDCQPSSFRMDGRNNEKLCAEVSHVPGSEEEHLRRAERAGRTMPRSRTRYWGSAVPCEPSANGSAPDPRLLPLLLRLRLPSCGATQRPSRLLSEISFEPACVP